MTARGEPDASYAARFRAKLLIAMMVVVTAITGIALYLGQRNAARAVEAELQREFQGELAAVHQVQEIRHATLVERCRTLVGRARIHAALEDNALDLLYPSAQDDLRDLLADAGAATTDPGGWALHASFYRFLDRRGAVIAPVGTPGAGWLRPDDEQRLALPRAPDRLQLGYLPAHTRQGTDTIFEVLAMPIVSTETGEVIAALVLGFRPASAPAGTRELGIRRGVWSASLLQMDGIPAAERDALAQELASAVAAEPAPANGLEQKVAGVPHLLFYKRLNPDSLFPPAYEVCIYPLTELHTRQRELGFQVLGAAGLLLAGGFMVSHLLATRLSRPVGELAIDSAQNRAERVRVEAALELTNEELQRAARFSADASHQLKTPVTVLRAGLEELLTRENLTPDECHEISALIHQTYRLSGVIEDLLLLSRLDAGRLKIDFAPVDLTYLIETALDDLGAQADGLDLKIETDFPPDLKIEGEKRYLGLILQNLLENARKYNRPSGRIRIVARAGVDHISIRVANTGQPIPPAAHAHIFERFHRGAMGENVPGYGLGLNLARELARLHHGDLCLVRSDAEETEFELRFPLAPPTVASLAS